MNKKFFISAIVSTLIFSQFGEASVNPENFFETTFYDMPEEVALASEAGKTLVIMYEQAGCPFCEKMRRDVLSKKATHDRYHKQFRIIQMDIRGSLETTDFSGKAMTQKKFSLSQNALVTPIFIFYDKTGREMHRLTGYYTVEQFILAADYISSGAYNKEKFSTWLKKKKGAGKN